MSKWSDLFKLPVVPDDIKQFCVQACPQAPQAYCQTTFNKLALEWELLKLLNTNIDFQTAINTQIFNTCPEESVKRIDLSGLSKYVFNHEINALNFNTFLSNLKCSINRIGEVKPDVIKFIEVDLYEDSTTDYQKADLAIIYDPKIYSLTFKLATISDVQNRTHESYIYLGTMKDLPPFKLATITSDWGIQF